MGKESLNPKLEQFVNDLKRSIEANYAKFDSLHALNDQRKKRVIKNMVNEFCRKNRPYTPKEVYTTFKSMYNYSVREYCLDVARNKTTPRKKPKILAQTSSTQASNSKNRTTSHEQHLDSLDDIVLKVRAGKYGEYALTASVLRCYNKEYEVNIKDDEEERGYFSKSLIRALENYVKREQLPPTGDYVASYELIHFTIEEKVVRRIKIDDE